MKSAFMLGAAALVASCVFAQDAFAQRSGSGEGGYHAAAPGHVGRPRVRVVIYPLRPAGHPRLGPVDIHRSQTMPPTRNSMAANDFAVFS